MGDLRDGRGHGEGTFMWTDGEIYFGSYEDGN